MIDKLSSLTYEGKLELLGRVCMLNHQLTESLSDTMPKAILRHFIVMIV